MSGSETLVDAFLAAAATNMCATHRLHGGPAATDAVTEIVVRHAPRGLVALPSADPTLDALDIETALRAAGCRVLRADEPLWRERIPEAAVGVTGATVAVVEQGVVAIASGPGAPRATSLLPAVHVCVVRSQDVVASFAEAIERSGSPGLPSALTWVGGPSRTGDLGMTLTLGVHGPRAVEIVVVGPDP